MAISSASSSRRGSFSSTSSTAPPRFRTLAPARPPTTAGTEETVVSVRGIPGGGGVRLKVDAAPGCGGIAWPSGEVMARYLAYRLEVDPFYLRRRTIVELGSGTGLVGIAAGLLERDTTICVTDQACLLDLMRRNVELNLPGRSHVRVAEYNWGEPIPDGVLLESGGVDMVLAADCVYLEPAFPLLIQTLCDLAPKGMDVEILFCWKKRRKADKRFFIMLKKHFDSTPVTDDRPGERERYNRDGVTLLHLTRRR